MRKWMLLPAPVSTICQGNRRGQHQQRQGLKAGRERTYEGEAPLEQVRDDTKEDHEDLNERPGDDDGDEGCSLRGRAEEA